MKKKKDKKGNDEYMDGDFKNQEKIINESLIDYGLFIGFL